MLRFALHQHLARSSIFHSLKRYHLFVAKNRQRSKHAPPLSAVAANKAAASKAPHHQPSTPTEKARMLRRNLPGSYLSASRGGQSARYGICHNACGSRAAIMAAGRCTIARCHGRLFPLQSGGAGARLAPP